MTYRTPLEMVEDATGRREEAREAFERADREWRDAIVTALLDDESGRAVAEAASISRARVYQIRDGKR